MTPCKGASLLSLNFCSSPSQPCASLIRISQKGSLERVTSASPHFFLLPFRLVCSFLVVFCFFVLQLSSFCLFVPFVFRFFFFCSAFFPIFCFIFRNERCFAKC